MEVRTIVTLCDTFSKQEMLCIFYAGEAQIIDVFVLSFLPAIEHTHPPIFVRTKDFTYTTSDPVPNEASRLIHDVPFLLVGLT
jgi:hypothetical protein